MQLRQCGKYNLRLPVLGMGCWAYGGGEYWGAQNQGDVDEVVRYAVDQGCCFFDTQSAFPQTAGQSRDPDSAKCLCLCGLVRPTPSA